MIVSATGGLARTQYRWPPVGCVASGFVIDLAAADRSDADVERKAHDAAVRA